MKKESKLPEYEPLKVNHSFMFSILLIIIFILLIFILPLYTKITLSIRCLLSVLMFIMVIIFNHKYIIYDYKMFINNKKAYIKFIIKNYLFMLLILFLISILILLINGGEISQNQKSINNIFLKAPIIGLLLSTLYAPFVEENIFRLSLSKIFKNKYLFMIVSSILFGLLHVIGNINSYNDLLYIIQYSAIGFCLSKSYINSKNIFVPIGIHFIQNFIAGLLSLLMYM